VAEGAAVTPGDSGDGPNIDTDKCDHVWTWIKDWGGDPNIINGTFDASYWQCAKCGSDECEDEPPIEGDDYEF
jgi:hypothetical protein